MSCSLAHDTPSAWNSLSHLVLWKASWRLSFHGLFSRHLPWFLPSLPGTSPMFCCSQNNTLCSPPWQPSIMPQLPTCTSGFPPRLCELLENQGSVLCVLASPSQDMVLSPLQMVVKWLNGWISLLGSGDARIVSQTILHNITWHVLSEILITLTLVTQPGDFHPN